MRLQFHVLAVALTAVACSGCITRQLTKNTIAQTASVSDVYQQQVLNNLAQFVYAPGSLPYFSLATQGTNQIQNTVGGSITPGFGLVGLGPYVGRVAFNAFGMSANGNHLANEAFTLVPVSDPRKLEYMRCAYQKAAAACIGGQMSTSCPDCQTRLNMFYTGDKDGDIAAKSKGKVTTECLSQHCWFHFGCKKCVPKNCGCLYVGEYCGTYVWVYPEDREELSKLTIAILDFAMNDPPKPRQKTVLYYVDEHGLPTTQENSVGTVTAELDIDDRIEGILKSTPKAQSEMEQVLLSSRQIIQLEIDALSKEPSSEINEQKMKDLLLRRRQIEQKLEFLRQQLDSPGLNNPFMPSVDGGSNFFPNLQFEQLLNQSIQTRP